MRVSIVVTAYNYARYVERCLRSCVGQHFPPAAYEVIAVDDASTDETRERVERFRAVHHRHTGLPRIRLICHADNRGVAAAANAAIREALGQYVIRVDADDFISADLLHFLVTYAEYNHDAFGVACDYLVVDDQERVLERRSAAVDPIACAILYRKDVLIGAGLYDPAFRHLEERELRQRLGPAYRLHYLPIPLYRYRWHGRNKSRSNPRALAATRRRLQMGR